MATQSALKSVLLRNAFYRDGYKRILCLVLLVLMIDLLLALGVFYQYTHPAQPQYFASTPSGRIILIHPLSDPVLTDQQVLQWVSMVIRKIYEIDFVHWRAQLQEISNYFTSDGWRSFSTALKQSDNLNTVTHLKMVVSAQITGAPVMTQKAVIDGHYAWKIQVPVLISYQNASRTPITQEMEITLIVLRMPVQQNPDRIAINNFIPTISGLS